ncbi:MAG: tetratricopeptide repeat protein [Spirochaetes bacterium]|nr:tetratricopeptide repeat protein [Spirochaetota bacterium]
MRSNLKKTTVILIIFLSAVPLYSQKAIDPKKTSERGVEFGQQKRYDEALKEFDDAIKAYNTSSSKTYHNKGWVFELKGDIPKAIACYEEALKRNPEQIPTLERAGYLYFRTGRFEEAVTAGENVIRLEPKNTEVIKWLPEAYAMRLKKQRDSLIEKQEEEKKAKEEKITVPAGEEKKEAEPPPRYIYASMDFMIRTAYYFKDSDNDKGFHYMTTPGYYTNVPEMLRLNITPSKLIEFDLEAGRPYLGALSPNLIIHTEKIEAIFHLGKYSLGIGGMGNHYRSSFAYADDKKRTLHDFKTGFIFGFDDEEVAILFKLYPRSLPHDSDGSSGRTLDVDYMLIDYRYKVDKLLNFYSWISVRDYYYFDHEAKISNYWGVYELGLGVSLGRYRNIGRYISYLSVSLDYTERFYMRDLNNDKPYNFANGQGWFGANADKWFEGNPFSGYRAPGHVVSFKMEEGIGKNFFLYQKLMIEMVDRREDHDEYCLTLGLGALY